eukprot:837551-Rhodomonas_salina.2
MQWRQNWWPSLQAQGSIMTLWHISHSKLSSTGARKMMMGFVLIDRVDRLGVGLPPNLLFCYSLCHDKGEQLRKTTFTTLLQEHAMAARWAAPLLVVFLKNPANEQFVAREFTDMKVAETAP